MHRFHRPASADETRAPKDSVALLVRRGGDRARLARALGALERGVALQGLAGLQRGTLHGPSTSGLECAAEPPWISDSLRSSGEASAALAHLWPLTSVVPTRQCQ